MPQQSVPENSVTPQVQSQVTPDLVSEQGKQQLAAKLSKTIEKKDFLDYILKGIAEKAGAEFSSRVKNPETVIQKIATKRIAGRDYNLEDVNDGYGARFIIKSSSDMASIKKMLAKAEELGVFKIGKQEQVTQATYSGFHSDITTPDGVKGEIQIQTPQQELEGVANHSLRAVFGEKPPEEVKALRDTQAELAKKISGNKAHEAAQTIQAIGKQNNDKPLDPRISAAILNHAKNIAK